MLAIGDAISSFNPVYGQGMSVAALEAVALRQTLAAGKDRLSQRYFKASGKIVDVAWDLAIGSDLSLPEVEGKRPILTRLSNAWSEHILKAAEHDPYVAEVFGSVTDLLAPPTVLMRPRFVWRVASRRARKPVAREKVPADDRTLPPSGCRSSIGRAESASRRPTCKRASSRLRLRRLGVAEDDLECALELCRRAELDDLGAGV